MELSGLENKAHLVRLLICQHSPWTRDPPHTLSAPPPFAFAFAFSNGLLCEYENPHGPPRCGYGDTSLKSFCLSAIS